MAMRKGETLKTYSDRYWEMFNEIDRDFDDIAIRTFKVGLPAKHDLRKSLTRKPVRSVCVGSWIALMSISGSRKTSKRKMGRLRWSLKIEEILGQTNTITTDLKEILWGHFGSTTTQVVSTVF